MAISKNLIQEVEMQIMGDPKASDLEVAIAVGVPEKEVKAIRSKLMAEKEKPAVELKPTPKENKAEVRKEKKAAVDAENEKTVAERKKDLQDSKPIDTKKELKFYYKAKDTGFVRELVRTNASQDIVLLTDKK